NAAVVHSLTDIGYIANVIVGDEDGPGGHPPALYYYGNVDMIGGTPTEGISRLDGNTWTPLASPGNSCKLAIFFDDGNGQRLYVINPRGLLSRWTGSMWEQAANGRNFFNVRSVAVFDDDGAGPHRPAIYLSAEFLTKIADVPV